jgi:hypothetical protein
MNTREFWAAEADKMRDKSAALDAVDYSPKTSLDKERDGAIIDENGRFKQIDGTVNYYFKERKEENLICTKNSWAKDKTIPKQYIKALASRIGANEIANLSDENIKFPGDSGVAEIVGTVAEIVGTLDAIRSKGVSEDGVPSFLIKFTEDSKGILNVYNSEDCFDYYRLGSVLVHENRHIRQVKILYKSLFAKESSGREQEMLITTFAGIKVAMENDAYRVQEEFGKINKAFNASKLNLFLSNRKKKSYDDEVKRLLQVLKKTSLEGIYKQQFEEAIKNWEEVFRKN